MKTAVLFTNFNRLDTAQKVFDQIKKAQPPRLYISSDGPRTNRPGEKEKIEQLRKVLFSQIDWECNVQYRFNEENLGCKNAISSAITWFFEHEEEGIILEDDCVPDPSFFDYCEKMLDAYRNDKRVMVISGTSYLFPHTNKTDSIYFMRYFAIWGWATWRRAWELFDISMKDWPWLKETHALSRLFDAPTESYYEQLFDEIAIRNANTWDIQWTYSCLFNHGLSVVPSKNLITNIGVDGTHTNGESPEQPTEKIHVDKITLPDRVFPDLEKEQLFFNILGANSMTNHITYQFKKAVRSLFGVNFLKKRN